MRRLLAILVLVVLVVVGVNLMSSSEKKEDEKRFQASLAEYQSALKPGSTRFQVEDYFRQHGTAFQRACCDAQNFADRASLGDEPRNLFCQPWKVSLDFQFKSAESRANVARDTDLLTAIDLHREGVCF